MNLTNEYRGVNSQSTNVMFEFTKCGLLVLMSINNIKTGRILLRLQLPGVIGRQGPGCVIMFANGFQLGDAGFSVVVVLPVTFS